MSNVPRITVKDTLLTRLVQVYVIIAELMQLFVFFPKYALKLNCFNFIEHILSRIIFLKSYILVGFFLIHYNLSHFKKALLSCCFGFIHLLFLICQQTCMKGNVFLLWEQQNGYDFEKLICRYYYYESGWVNVMPEVFRVVCTVCSRCFFAFVFGNILLVLSTL